ncbi:non-homologous end-joining DNA ligase [Oceanithermus sp.]|uniref:non-homologous end-joining DNA ligase n=1 Tax=Oceanithermus sp. TaxID=2268145 RepID=UPI0025E1D91F|nr:non-homologous end-joining DNA ligase [Oceanithermus sp.]
MARREVWKLAGQTVEVKNLDKVFWPAQGYTKGDLLRYYREVAPVLLPYLRGRPLTLVMCPDGIAAGCYYRRKRPDYAPDWLPYVLYNPKTRTGRVPLVLVENEAHLIWLANQAAVEFHVWSSTARDLAHPTWLVLDLDPGNATGFETVLEAARFVRKELEELGLAGWPKTSGGRGLHLLVPLEPGRYTHAQARAWAKAFAARLAQRSGGLVRLPRGATHRGEGVHVDYAQNGYGRNTAAPYSLRAKPGAPVSTPLGWDEVETGGFEPADFDLQTVPERIRRQGDPLASMREAAFRLPEL